MNYINIGRTRKAHGLTGEMKISIEEHYLEDFFKNDRIFIQVRGVYVPYFIGNVRGKGDIILKLEEVDNRDAAQVLQGKDIFLREQDLLSEEEREFEIPEDNLEYGYLVGYKIIDKNLGEIGVIDEVLDMPQQEMAFMRYKGREVLIPLNSQMILEIETAKREVQMDLPEGLLEV